MFRIVIASEIEPEALADFRFNAFRLIKQTPVFVFDQALVCGRCFKDGIEGRGVEGFAIDEFATLMSRHTYK